MRITLLTAIHPNLPSFVILGIIIIGLGVILRWLRQPFVVAYIVAGVLLGEYGFGLVTDDSVINSLGEFGLILLLFFIGMEISLPDLVKNWRAPLLGTAGQVLASVGLTALIGWAMDWPWSQIVMLGFVLALSSSAVVIKLLDDAGETNSDVGQKVISILLMQDVLIVPMLIATDYLGGRVPPTEEVLRQVIGGVLIIGFLFWILKKKHVKLPYTHYIRKDHELQVFIAFIICFGFALLTALLGLSAALGAFLAGIYVHAARSTQWFHDSLHSFRVIFVALFFVSIGLMIDLDFLMANLSVVLLLVGAAYLSNHFINSLILHSLGSDWRNSLYGGGLLAQIGELSFIIAATGQYTGIIGDYGYQLAVLVISLTLLISPFWIGLTRSLIPWKKRSIPEQPA